MAEQMFDGFDHTQYRDEVEARWGKQAYADSNRWWNSLSAADKKQWQQQVATLATDWSEAATRGLDPEGEEAQSLAQRQFDWLSGIPGTPQEDGKPTKQYFVGLADMYVADERFAANYGGPEGAGFVRDAMKVFAERNL